MPYYTEYGRVFLNYKSLIMRTLYVKPVKGRDINQNWRLESFHYSTTYYARCNKLGVINWRTTLIYSAHELVPRNNVKIL